MHERHGSRCGSPLRSPLRRTEDLRSIEVAFHAAVDFGHGQNTGVGWSDPTSLPRKPWRSLQPTVRCDARRGAKGDRDAASHPEELRASRELRILRSGNLRQMRNRTRRFTRHNASEVYCSRECRGDAERSATHRRGRPRKYKTERERRAAKTRRQQVYRSHPNVEKTVRIQSETKNLQTQKVPLSYLGTPGPGEPLSSSLRT